MSTSDTPDLFKDSLKDSLPTDGTGRKPTLQEYIAWQVKHDAKREAQEKYEQDVRDRAKP